MFCRSQRSRFVSTWIVGILLTVFSPPSVRAGLVFNFSEGTNLANLATSNPTLYADVRNGFNAAAAVWQNLLFDNVTLNFLIDYKPLDPGIIGETGSTTFYGDYTEIRDALRADAQTAYDQGAANALPNTSSLSIRTNARNGSIINDNDGSANNSLIVITSANARALGFEIDPIGGPPVVDGDIAFSSMFSFDFHAGNGITAGTVDFIAVATHEIGHALGFLSGIDVVDYYTGAGAGANSDLNGAAAGIGTLDPYFYFTVMDLFRSSSASVPGTFDWTTGGSPAFTTDAGVTLGPLFSTGRVNGDGQQASHWKDNLGLGLMDPTLGYGELGVITTNDLRAFDVIGWDLQAVPEPTSFALCTSLAAGWWFRRRRAA